MDIFQCQKLLPPFTRMKVTVMTWWMDGLAMMQHLVKSNWRGFHLAVAVE